MEAEDRKRCGGTKEVPAPPMTRPRIEKSTLTPTGRKRFAGGNIDRSRLPVAELRREVAVPRQDVGREGKAIKATSPTARRNGKKSEARSATGFPSRSRTDGPQAFEQCDTAGMDPLGMRAFF